MSSTLLTAPELMAPAGDWDCARAAVENGADAIYFGLQGGLNARARAVNFAVGELAELMTFVRTHGVKGYLTLNTLVFSDELEEAERTVRLAVTAGVDAVLVQDIGLLRLIRRICPELPIHASTQMTISSAECFSEIESLGVRRVVLPRELSIAQIAAVHKQTDVELEAFVHGALCMSYSGQCLASLAFGGRSANRGQCAQPCRLPYEMICDGRSELPGGMGSSSDRVAADSNTGRQAASATRQAASATRQAASASQAGNTATSAPYPLSPHDLAAYDRLPELIAAGVSAVKIEGRLKPADYVATVTRNYRAAIDAICGATQAGNAGIGPTEIAEMEATFSRGFCHGWLDGSDHRALVSGASSAKRGTYLGEVRGVRGERIMVELAGPVRRGDGLVFEGDRSQKAEQGGRVYEVFQERRSVEEAVSSGLVELAFRYGAIDRAEIRLGQKVWKTDDPQLARRLRAKREGRGRCVPLDIAIEAAVGAPLQVTATAATGAACRLQSPQPLEDARKHALNAEVLVEQFGRLGGTPYELRKLDARIDGRPMVPLSVLGKLRHEMLRLLEAAAGQTPVRAMMDGAALDALRAGQGRGSATPTPTMSATSTPTSRATANMCAAGFASAASVVTPAAASKAQLHVLCRSMKQVEAALACGVSSVIVEIGDVGLMGDAVRAARAGGAEVVLAGPRIHRPGEIEIFESLAKHRPDGILVRNLAGLAFCRRVGMPAVADFSLEAVNELSVQWLHERGARRVTAAYDLSPRQLLDLTDRVPPEWLEVVVHRHTPLFHTAHCVFCWALSRGKDRRSCGQPCQRHELRLRDRMGVEHPLLADGQCDNTLFHAEAESLGGAAA
jgi:U32 family peptidase